MDQQSTLKQVTIEPLWHEMSLDEVQTALRVRQLGRRVIVVFDSAEWRQTR